VVCNINLGATEPELRHLFQGENHILEANFDAYITSFFVHTSFHAKFWQIRYDKWNIWRCGKSDENNYSVVIVTGFLALSVIGTNIVDDNFRHEVV